ncbi:phospholipase D family protein [Deinococcus sp. HMF7604]|uniref:phospholipase D-like domain-containing protein n=1 Tax=Deinococcus betulae TaxID=2873312 RepID=UPI001CCB1AB8|nr:phospholipase D-like domain-containing protein [Deinococcus betulae]MBZ9751744.1 phospholipase D family protein [Deinococcus betulae]
MTYRDLAWVEDLLGEGSREALWQRLKAAGALDGEGDLLRPGPLAALLGDLAGDRGSGLLWTLPESLNTALSAAIPSSHPPTPYLDGLTQTIDAAQKELRLMSPFLTLSGITVVSEALLRVLARGVRTSLIAQDLHDLASLQSRAVEPLRQSAERLGASLSVYSARHTGGLLHAKLAVADQTQVVLGSANMTGHGLGMNFEVGVRLGPSAARQVADVYDALQGSSLIEHVFSTMG